MGADCRPASLRQACEASLRRLRLERVNLYQLHTVDPQVPLEESVGGLAELQAQGQGAPHWRLQCQSRAAVAGLLGGNDRLRSETATAWPITPGRACSGHASVMGWHFCASRSRRACRKTEPPQSHRRGARGNPGSDRARVVAASVSSHASNSRHVVCHSSRGEPRGERSALDRRRARGSRLLSPREHPHAPPAVPSSGSATCGANRRADSVTAIPGPMKLANCLVIRDLVADDVLDVI